MNCPDAEFVMPLYLSGELDATTMAQFDRHIETCPACLHKLEEQQSLDAGLRSALLAEPIESTSVRNNVLAQIKSTPRSHRASIAWITAIAAALLVAITLGLATRDNARYEQASADHIYEVIQNHQKNWQTQASLEQFVAQKVSSAQLGIPGYHLLRGKECRIAKTPYVHLVYGSDTDSREQISMYVLSGDQGTMLRRIATSLMPGIRSRAQDGLNVTEGDSSGRRILLVSTLPQNEEQHIVRTMLQTMS